MPLILDSAEWAKIEAAVIQRATLLNHLAPSGSGYALENRSAA